MPGAIFLGRHTPEAIGDYVGGSNHVLPTSRSARFSSGPGRADFLKRTSIVACTPAVAGGAGSRRGGAGRGRRTGAHGRSVSIRLAASHVGDGTIDRHGASSTSSLDEESVVAERPRSSTSAPSRCST
jgi:hypothetical protein